VTAAQRRWRLDLSYDGRGFHGFAAQPGTETVAGAIGDALALALRLDEAPVLTCAGRTDAGVHALGQVLHVDLPEPLFAEDRGPQGARLRRALNGLLAGRVAILSASEADARFDARFDATSRSYRYVLHESDTPSPLLDGLAWRVEPPLDLRAMAQAGYALLGEHDFRAFCRRPAGTDAATPILRRILDLSVAVADDSLSLAGTGRLVRLDVTAQAFCHQMVRSITATLVAVGQGRLSGADVVAHLRAATREGLPAPAPPEGLCLVQVAYG